MLSKIAFKTIKQKPLRSIVAGLTIAIGVGALVVFFGLSNGIHQATFEQVEKTLGFNQITVRPKITAQGLGSFLKQSSQDLISPDTINEIEKINGVKTVHTQNQFGSFASVEASVLGVSFLTDSMIFGLEEEFILDDLPNSQVWQSAEEPYPALIPRKLLELYNLTIAAPQSLPTFAEEDLLGKKLILYPNYSTFFPVNDKGEEIELEVVGFSDRINIIGITIPYELTENLNNKFGEPTKGFNQIFVDAKNESEVPEIAKKLEEMGLVTNYLQKNFESIQSKLAYLQNSLQLISLLIIILVIIAISSNYLATISERKREIGLFRALGANRSQIRHIIIQEATMICLLGGIIGLILALIASTIINQKAAQILTQISLSNQNLIQISPKLMLGAIISATLLSVISAYLPALKASYSDPTESLK